MIVACSPHLWFLCKYLLKHEAKENKAKINEYISSNYRMDRERLALNPYQIYSIEHCTVGIFLIISIYA
jgi:hypothetical protein